MDAKNGSLKHYYKLFTLFLFSENENSQDEFGFFSMVDSTLGKADRDKGSSDTSGDTLPTLPQSTGIFH